MATRLDAVCVALTALWTSTFAASSMKVVDGPQANADPTADWLFVGHDGDAPAPETEIASAAQDWMAYAKVKKEQGEIICAVIAVNGGTVDIPAVRARALQVVDDCEDAIRADPTIGGLVMDSGLSEHHVFAHPSGSGCKARVVFTVSYLAQL